jgi:hypothetical protein
VIGEVLRAGAGGAGFRKIAALVGRPGETVRGWLRAGRRNAVAAVGVVMRVLLQIEPLAPPPVPRSLPLAGLVEVVGLLGSAVGRRFGPGRVVSPWQVAAAVTGGLLLSPGLASW